MHVARVDLNLLVVFEAVFAQGGLSRAARQLHLSQPAVSHALKRLRETYQDELFVRQGHQMLPTPFARKIRPDIQRAIGLIQQTLVAEQTFQPEQSDHSFHLGMRDVVEAVLLPELVRRVSRQASAIKWSAIQVPRREMAMELATGRLDLAFDVLLSVPEQLNHQRILQDHYVVVARKGHPLLSNGLSLDGYLSAQHIVVSSRRSGRSVEDFELSRLGHSRRIALRCQHYLAAWGAAAKTDWLLTMPGSFIHQHTDYFDLQIVPMPVGLPPLEVYMYWHRSLEGDPANLWLRQVVLDVLPGACGVLESK